MLCSEYFKDCLDCSVTLLVYLLLQAQKFDIYVKYCTNKPHSTQLLVQHGGAYFENLQKKYSLEHPIAAYLIKPVQRITKYQLLLKGNLASSMPEELLKTSST